MSSGTTPSDRAPLISETALALSEACIRCARRSYRILTESWINGSFPTFDFTYTQYLFSASIILAISSLQNPGPHNDGDDFEAAAQILNQLDQNGNFAAKEYSTHVETIIMIIKKITSDKSHVGHHHDPEPALAANDGMSHPAQETRPPVDMAIDTSSLTFTEPSLQDLLSQPTLDLEFLEPSIIDCDFQAFVWPEEGASVWGMAN
jgi:proline utilization trans-activator